MYIHFRSVLIMRIFLPIVIDLVCTNLTWAESAVFDYNDFGPQVLAYETIGFQWYQWNSSGDSDPKKIDTIKVVVYWHEPLDGIKEKYPVDYKRNKDYRYLPFESAIKYLDYAIVEIPDAKYLVETRDRLLRLKGD